LKSSVALCARPLSKKNSSFSSSVFSSFSADWAFAAGRYSTYAAIRDRRSTLRPHTQFAVGLPMPHTRNIGSETHSWDSSPWSCFVTASGRLVTVLC
jgi:hypothetical protein